MVSVKTAFRSRKFLLASLLFSLVATHSSAALTSTSTTLVISANGNPVASGGSVSSGTELILSATVLAGASPVTTGQVSFCDASAPHCSDIHQLGVAQLTSSGTAVLRVHPGAGTRSYRAVFLGTTLNAAGKSAVITLNITGTLATKTSLASSGSPGNYTLAATVSGTGNTVSPTGNVSFVDTTSQNLQLGMASLTPGPSAFSLMESAEPTAQDLAWSITTGDFNNDGIPDIAIANYGAGNVSILLGNGDGTFTEAPGSPIAVTFDPQGIVAADFNGDGKLDLAMENSYYSSVLTVLLGNGDGTFTSAPGSPISLGGESSQAIATADLNGDGIPDLIAGNSGELTVLLGNGNGSFSPVTAGSLNVADPLSIAAGDFNSDGIADLAVADFANAGQLYIFLGKGDGTFTQSTDSPITVGSFPWSVVAADFDGDGKLDLAVDNSYYTSASSGNVSILRGNGDGTFTPFPNSPVTVGDDPVSLVAGDFNQDGKVDLATANNDSDTVTILLGNGDGTFTTAPNNILLGDFPQSIASADFNGDGFADLAIANYGGPDNDVLLSQITASSTATLGSVSPVGSGTHLVQAQYPGDDLYQGSTSSTVALTAQPPPGFSLASTAVTVNPGATSGNTSTIAVTPSGGFTGNVGLSASLMSSPSGAVNLPTLSFGSASPVSITGSAPATATLTISTTAGSSSPCTAKNTTGNLPWRVTGGGAALAGLLLLVFPARRSRWRCSLGLFVLFIAASGGLVSCGGSGGGSGHGCPALAIAPTTAGTYTITVTGTSGATTATTTVNLTVQ